VKIVNRRKLQNFACEVTESFNRSRMTSDCVNSICQCWIPNRQRPLFIATVQALCTPFGRDSGLRRINLDRISPWTINRLALVVAMSSNASTTLSSKKAYPQHDLRCAIESTRRKLVWVTRQRFEGWACSECAWIFSPLGPLVGGSIDDMKTRYEQQREKEFTSHVCAKHRRALKNPP
jgi:hypothetical protein